MALIEPFMIKSAFGLSADTAVELTANTGESFMIKDVIICGASDDYALLEIDKTTVGFFRVDHGSLGSHLPVNRTSAKGNVNYSGFRADSSITLIAYMIRKGWMEGYPVAEGQTFRVKPFTSGKSLSNVIIIYEKYDAEDIKKDMPNGSNANEFVFVNYGQPSSPLTTGGDYEINKVVTCAEFPDFPIGDAVPAKQEIEILGVLGSEAIDYDGTDDYTCTKYLKFFKGRKVLFDEDRNGLPFYQPVFTDITAGTYFGRGISVVGNYSLRDRREPFLPQQPLIFKAGDELKVYITAEQGTNAGSISGDYAEIAFIERVKILE